jgi:hypothetical protein
MGEVTVHFRGACTHFHGVVPDVPHRAVLVNGSAIRFGKLLPHSWLPDGRQQYALFPHVGFLQLLDPEFQPRFQVENAIEKGFIHAPVRLQIANAQKHGLFHELAFRNRIPRLTEYVEDYRYSPDVVLNGRATCYFDFSDGHVGSETLGNDARHTMVTVQTDGDPVLRVTPMGIGGRGAKPVDIPLPSASDLYVANRDLAWPEREAPFDFLLHFLTSAEGIPQRLTRAPHGFPETLDEAPPIWVYTKHLWMLLRTGWPGLKADIKPENFNDLKALLATSPTCSDSQYP